MSEKVALEIEVNTAAAIKGVNELDAALKGLVSNKVNIPTQQLQEVKNSAAQAEQSVGKLRQAFKILGEGGSISFSKSIESMTGDTVQSIAKLNNAMSLVEKNRRFNEGEALRDAERRLRLAGRIRAQMQAPLNGVSAVERDTQLMLKYGDAAFNAAKNFDDLVTARNKLRQGVGDELLRAGDYKQQLIANKLRRDSAIEATDAEKKLDRDRQASARTIAAYERERRRQRQADIEAAFAQADKEKKFFETEGQAKIKVEEKAAKDRQASARTIAAYERERRRQRQADIEAAFAEEDRLKANAVAGQSANRQGLLTVAGQTVSRSAKDAKFERGESLKDAQRRLDIINEINRALSQTYPAGLGQDQINAQIIKRFGGAAFEAAKDPGKIIADVERLTAAQNANTAATKEETAANNALNRSLAERRRQMDQISKDSAFISADPRSQLRSARRSQTFQDRLISSGASPDEARAQSVRRFGEEVTRASNAIPQLEANERRLHEATGNAARSQHSWNLAAHEGHSLARGFAGTLGNLWLTYGSLAPLLAGAALGAGFREASKQGSEFEYQLTFVKALSGETADSVARIGEAAKLLGSNSLFAPVEIASGFRILAQAGIKAKDSISAMLPTLDLATVGEMKMEDAATTLVGVMNAFSLTTSDLTHIGDVFAKAAAESQTSVEGIANAMKYASVVGEQYNANLEDTATALTLLAKLNITGTSAGTAFRNMLKELYSPTKQAGGVMERIGLKTSDNGELRSFVDIVFDLQKILGRFDKASQVKILQSIFGERGAKEAIAILGQTREEWNRLNKTIAQSDGFMRGVSEQLEATAKGGFKQAIGTLQAQFVDAFDGLAPQMNALTLSLKEAFASQEFKDGLTSSVKLVGSLTSALISLIGPASQALSIFSSIAPAVGGLAVAAGLAAVFSSLEIRLAASVAATAGLTGAFTSLSAATVAAGGSMAVLKSALASFTLPGRALALFAGALTGLYLTFKRETPTAVVEMGNFNTALDTQVEKLKLVNKELDNQIEARRRNITLTQLEQEQANNVGEQKLAQMRIKRESLISDIAETKAERGGRDGNRNLFSARELFSNEKAVQELDAQIARAEASLKAGKTLAELEKKKREELKKFEQIDLEKARSKIGVGEETFDKISGEQSKRSVTQQIADIFRRDQIAAVKAINDLTKAEADMMSLVEGRTLIGNKKFSELSAREKATTLKEFGEADAAEKAARAEEFRSKSLKSFADTALEVTSANEGLTKSEKDLLQIMQSPDWAKASEVTRTEIELAQLSARVSEDRKKKQDDLRNSLREAISDANREEDTIQKHVKALEDEEAALGQTTKQREQSLIALNNERIAQTELSAAIYKRLAADAEDNKDANAARSYQALSDKQFALAAQQRKEVETQKGIADKKLAIEKDWLSGAKNAFEDYAVSTQNMSKSMYDVIGNGLKGLEDAFVQFATTGKLSIRDLVTSTLAELARMQIRKGILGPLSEMIGKLFKNDGGDNVLPGLDPNGFEWGQSYGSTPFAKGGVFTNKLFNKPTMFASGGKFGVMGEAGPEAVMPLQRDRQGRLGVISAGSGEGQQINIVNNISIAKDGSATTQNSTDGVGSALAKQIDAAILAVLMRERRPGGLLYS